jgi:secreted trypsin-like serine protease
MWADLAENSICFDYSSGGTCFGDSGGPALLVREGIEYVAGVGSVGGQECAHYHCSAMVDPAEDFIHGIAAPDGSACSTGDQCLSDHCAQGVCAPDTGGGGCATASGRGAAGLFGLLLWLAYVRRARFML